ncbi:DUF6705 family protein [Chryseobacterium sp.]|uniref:DUF6705 family protein n=1 Tax=Chryseobacterium sp. TaxID=1871047 RepID=UPI0012C1886D|nr:DUF6705 family protein [Chryseobacterium sp.]MPS64204.1 hypothetical protein [Chryseobacterium sp.]
MKSTARTNIFILKYYLLLFILFTVSCKSQTVSLETAAQCMQENPPFPCPNFTYVKDINNSLNKYVGTWEGSLNGKNYEFKFIKKENVGEDIKDDRLIGRLRITDSNGNIIYNSFTEADDDKTHFFGTNFQPDLKAYIVYFHGPSIGCAEYGDVYLRIQPTTPDQMTAIMIPDNDTTIEGKCPINFQPTIPYEQLIHLIKQ